MASPNLAACLSPFPQLMISYNGFAFSFASWVKTNQYPSQIFKTISIKLLGLFLFSLWVISLLDQYSVISFMFLLVSQIWAAVSPFPSWIVTRGGRRSARPGPLTLCQESLKVGLGLSLGCRRGICDILRTRFQGTSPQSQVISQARYWPPLSGVSITSVAEKPI